MKMFYANYTYWACRFGKAERARFHAPRAGRIYARFLLLAFAAAVCVIAPAGCASFAPPTQTPKVIEPTGTEPSLSPTSSPVSPPPSPSSAQEPSPSPSPTPAPSPTPTPLPSPTKKPTVGRPLSGVVIGIDPGHQAHSNSGLEPVAPGSGEMKKKVSSGTQGQWTRVCEYEVNLNVGLMLKTMLEREGATVIMTRETNDVDISNAERAKLFNAAKTDYAVRLHCNGSENQNKRGAFMLIPKSNPYLSDCKRAAGLLLDEFCKSTGAPNLGVTVRSDQTGFNWCERMIINIEMGHMSNKEEDYLLADSAYQKKMAVGLFNGIMAYFS